MNLKKYALLILFVSCFVTAQKTQFILAGRVEKMSDNKIMLISPASSISFDFEGNSCAISLQNVDTYDHQNFVSLELDGQYIGRVTIEKGAMKSYPVTISSNKKRHHLAIYKATEATTGGVLFEGTTAKVVESSAPKGRKKIELIGDSITSGFGNDTTTIPCDKGDWFSHHNAYWAYGPIVARNLNADFILNSVSGYGMYRNWNDDHIEEPNLPDVYQNLYLNTDALKPYDFAFQPDLVSICLGTNDLSDGDGKKERLPFNEEKYVSNYIDLIKVVYEKSPNTRIVLLTSPMVSGDKNITLVKCLKKVMQAFEKDTTHKPIALFEFQPMTPKGCGYHPDIDDDKVMADQLIPVFKKLLDEK